MMMKERGVFHGDVTVHSRAIKVLPEEFTISEMQTLSESVLGERLDKVTFRRRMEVGEVALALEGKMRTGGAFRPAQLYSLSVR